MDMNQRKVWTSAAVVAGLLSSVSLYALPATALETAVAGMPANPAPAAAPHFVWGVGERSPAQIDYAWFDFAGFAGFSSDAQSAPWLEASATVGQSGGASIFATGSTGLGVTVAIVDTGVDLDHPEFTGRMLAGACFGACPFGTPQDDNFHGTHVAGIVAAANNGTGNTGVAPQASIMPVKVLSASGSGSYDDVAAGIRFAAANGADVINLSLGGSSGYTPLLNALAAAKSTSVIVAAAGNGGNRLRPAFPAAYATNPSVVGSMLIVGSVDSRNRISTFSQTPGTAGCQTVGRNRYCFRDFFVVAPGERIYSTVPDNTYANATGTSMATPFVAGTAALILSASPFLTPAQVVEIIKRSATDLGARGVDSTFGWGLVNPVAAIAPLGAPSVPVGGGRTFAYTGTGDVRTSSLNGVLGHAVRQSALASNLVMLDDYGRDYQVNLATAVGDARISVTGAAFSNASTARAMSFSDGDVSFFAVRDERSPNAVDALGFATGGETIRLTDMVTTVRLRDNDTLTFGHEMTMAGRFNALDLRASEAFDGLFLSAEALNSPYLSLTDGGDFASYATDVGEGLRLSVGHAAVSADTANVFADGVYSLQEQLATVTGDPNHQRSASNTMVSLTYAAAPWAMLGAVAGYTDEENSLLGAREYGALALTGQAHTVSAGASARISLGDGWIATGSWSMGTTSMTPENGSLIASVSEIQSQSYGIAISKRGVIGDEDSIGLSVSRPLHVTSGTAVLRGAVAVTEAREIVYGSETLNLASGAPETQVELGYTTPVAEHETIGISALYQENAGGEAGRDAVGLVANWRMQF